jgi:protein O-mannosyl-transferase
MTPSAPHRLDKSNVSTRPVGAPELLSPRVLFVAGLCLAAAVFAVYRPSLGYEFVLDDHRFTSDPRIQSSGYVWDYFANYVWAQFTGGQPSFYRPIFILWLRINFILSELTPWGWHLLSITKHVAAAWLLGLLVWKLLRDRLAALLAATLFALHPAQAESVAWVTVPDPLMSIGILAALLLYLRYTDTSSVFDQAEGRKSRKARSRFKNAQPSSKQSSTIWIVAAAAACLAAMLAKETAIIFPALIFVLALNLPTDRSVNSISNKENAKKGWILRALHQTLPFFCAAALYILLRFSALNGKLCAQTQHLPWTTVVWSWPAIFCFYIRVMFWPSQSYTFADPILVDKFSVHGVVLPAVCILAAFAILAMMIWWAWKKSHRELSGEESFRMDQALIIGLVLLILPILPALNLNALNPGDFLHGRYTYLPLAGLALLMATAFHLAGWLRIPLLCAAAAVAVAFSILTTAQEKMWHDDLTLFTTAHRLASQNAPVAQNLANARVQAALKLDDEGRCSEAMPVFEQVTREYPQDWFAWAGMADCLVQLNDLVRAEDALHHAADLSREPRVAQQWRQLRERMGLTNSAR